MRLIACAAVALLATACPKRAGGVDVLGRQGFPLIAAVAEKETTARKERRSDVEIDTRENDRVPRVVGTGETPMMQLDGARARLYGDALGTLNWAVDNVLLLEVMNAKGEVISRAAVGFTEPVTIGRDQVDYVGPRSFQFGPGEVDITSMLPENEPFKVKATALDYAGVGRVTDVFVVLEQGRAGGPDDDLRGQ